MPRGERGQDPLPRSFLRLDPALERYAQPKPPGSVSWDCRGPRACGVRSLPSDGGRGPPALPSPRPPPAGPDAPRRLLVVVSEAPRRRRRPDGPRATPGGSCVGRGRGTGMEMGTEMETGMEMGMRTGTGAGTGQGGDVDGDGDGEDRLGVGAAPAGEQRAPAVPERAPSARRAAVGPAGTGRGCAGSPRLHLRGSASRVPGAERPERSGGDGTVPGPGPRLSPGRRHRSAHGHPAPRKGRRSFPGDGT